jgi:hypothetical protein
MLSSWPKLLRSSKSRQAKAHRARLSISGSLVEAIPKAERNGDFVLAWQRVGGSGATTRQRIVFVGLTLI